MDDEIEVEIYIAPPKPPKGGFEGFMDRLTGTDGWYWKASIQFGPMRHNFAASEAEAKRQAEKAAVEIRAEHRADQQRKSYTYKAGEEK